MRLVSAILLWLLLARRRPQQPSRGEPVTAAKQLPSSPPRPSPNRHRALDIINIFGLITAIVALVFTYQSARDTARQLEFSTRQLESAHRQIDLMEAQSQPTFRLAAYPKVTMPYSSSQQSNNSRLVLSMTGSAEDVVARTWSAFIFLSDSPGTIRVARTFWWRETSPVGGEAARWHADRSQLTRLYQDGDMAERELRLVTIIEVTYDDVFDRRREKYLTFLEPVSAIGPPTINTEAKDVPECMARTMYPAPKRTSSGEIVMRGTFLPPHGRPYSAADLVKYSHTVPQATVLNCPAIVPFPRLNTP